MALRKLRDRPHLRARARPSTNTSTTTAHACMDVVASRSPTSVTTSPVSTAASFMRLAISKFFHSSRPGILSLPIELIFEIGYQIPDTHTLNNLIRSHPVFARILSRQLYYRAFNWDKRAAIRSRLHYSSRAALQEYVTRVGHGHTLRVLLDWYGLDITSLLTSLYHIPDYAIAILNGEHPISSKGPGRKGPLHIAALRGHASICDVLLERCSAVCSIQDTDGQDETPLHYAARGLCPSKAVALLIDKGANVEAVNKFGRTPLHVAIELDSIDAVRVLLEKGANPVATVRKMSSNTKDEAQNNEFSATRLALSRKIAHDEGHLVKDRRLTLIDYSGGVLQLLTEYEVKARIVGNPQTLGKNNSQLIIAI